ncbi:GIY-YIG nuclease family protein [Sinorhizobium americanum]|uniref:Uncharacterized protein n=1 Tax=Sinorhizobium americanum TaxID=194963 RepID=A0A1L3LLY9_9HYPH|nr:GIY-YIG nuclease family protein [Sinorhizobium americanum]APG91122.1 hypothetical protein SAMCFNEI73_Ch1832 [Sinorhizobium americanum]
MSIYVLRSDNLVKIGFTDDLRARVQAIVAAVPVPVEFVGHMPGGREVEAHLHGVFAQSLFAREWFVETPAMRSLFETILIPNLPEVATQKQRKRTAQTEAQAELSTRVRDAAEQRWPRLSKAERVEALAADLGWNRGRAKDLYYADPRVSLRDFERAELDVWFARRLEYAIAPELREEEGEKEQDQ